MHLILMTNFYLTFLFLLVLVFSVTSLKVLPNSLSQRFITIFFPRIFIILSLIVGFDPFRVKFFWDGGLTIYLFIFLHVRIQLSKHLLEGTIISQFKILAVNYQLNIDVWTHCWAQFYPLIDISIFIPNYIVLVTLALLYVLKFRRAHLPTWLLFFEFFLGYSDSLAFPYEF